jgi:hypothetical protein
MIMNDISEDLSSKLKPLSPWVESTVDVIYYLGSI